MHDEKNLLDGLAEVWRGFNQLWLWLTGTGVIGAALVFVFREFLVGIIDAVGSWFALKVLGKQKVQHIKEKAARADERGKLHAFLAEELYKVNQRLDGCENRHKDRDKKDEERHKSLTDCHKRREELEIKNVKFISDARAAAIENAKLLAENSSLRGRLKRG